MEVYVYQTVIPHVIIALIFLLAIIIGLRAAKKFAGAAEFSSAFPYLVIGCSLFFVGSLVHLTAIFIPLLENSPTFNATVNVFNIFAGVFFLNGFYDIYQGASLYRKSMPFRKEVRK